MKFKISVAYVAFTEDYIPKTLSPEDKSQSLPLK